MGHPAAATDDNVAMEAQPETMTFGSERKDYMGLPADTQTPRPKDDIVMKEAPSLAASGADMNFGTGTTDIFSSGLITPNIERKCANLEWSS